MRYYEFDIQDFIEDEKFKEWVYEPTEGLNIFWETWISKNPTKEKTIEEAKELLIALQFQRYHLSEDRKEKIWNQIEVANDEFRLTHPSKDSKFFTTHFSDSKKILTKYAASMGLILLALGLWINQYTNKEQGPGKYHSASDRKSQSRRPEIRDKTTGWLLSKIELRKSVGLPSGFQRKSIGAYSRRGFLRYKERFIKTV